MDTKESNLVKWFNSGKYISIFDASHPSRVLERATTKCSTYVPGSYKPTTNKYPCDKK